MPLHRNAVFRALMVLCALLCVALGVVGIFVPGLPTTPFILLAAWFAARGSPQLLGWLEGHRLFGPMVKNWRAYGAVSRRAKWLATVMMALCAGVMGVFVHTLWAVLLAVGTMACVLLWLWLRPEPPATDPPHAATHR